MTVFQANSMLITGGAGFIGANFIRYVLNHEPNTHIINLDNLTYAGNLENLKNLPHEERYHFIQGDICDRTLVRHLLLHHNIDTIVHFAAESHVDRSISSPSTFVETNVLGTLILLEAAKHHWFDVENRSPQHCRFHHISTDEVFGALQLNDAAFNETSAYHPNSPYSASKAGADHLVNAYYHTYGLPITISNCSNNYGPYQHTEKFIPTVIKACLEQKPIPIYGNGKNIRDWIYVEDHCRGILEVIKHGKVGESYNLGGNNQWENLALVELICAKMDRLKPRKELYNKLISFVKDRPGHDFRYAIDTGKIKRELRWEPRIPMEQGLDLTIKFYLPLTD